MYFILGRQFRNRSGAFFRDIYWCLTWHRYSLQPPNAQGDAQPIKGTDGCGYLVGWLIGLAVDFFFYPGHSVLIQ